MKYESLVTFPPIFRKLAADLKAPQLSASDCLALLIAQHWMTGRGERFVSMPFALGEDGLKIKAVLRVDDPTAENPKKVAPWTCRVLGVEESQLNATWKLRELNHGYSHLWLWHIAPEAVRGEHIAHHWRGPRSDFDSWPMIDGQRTLALKDLLDQDPIE